VKNLRELGDLSYRIPFQGAKGLPFFLLSLCFPDRQVLWIDLFLPLLSDFIQPYQKSLHEIRRVDGQPPHGIMKPVHRLDPGANSDTAASATGPLPLIDSPKPGWDEPGWDVVEK
jgi:hypothetical protein